VEFVCPNQGLLAETTIHHYAKDFEVLAAISLTFITSITLTTVEVGFHRAEIAGFNIFNPFPNFEDFHPQFMSRDSGIIEKWKFSVVTTDISPANPHPQSPDFGFPGTGSGRQINIDGRELFRFSELPCLHQEKKG
tara:strand:+ start:18 stop:425 length:408 start_codon:yes stop_codon:yes gene_type:complete